MASELTKKEIEVRGRLYFPLRIPAVLSGIGYNLYRVCVSNSCHKYCNEHSLYYTDHL